LTIDALNTTSLAILDGLHRIDSGTVTVLQRLTQDRDLTLHDGTRLVSQERYQSIQSELGASDARMHELGLRMIHPSFRIIALAEPPAEGQRSWLTEEILSMFHFHQLKPLSVAEEHLIVDKLVPGLDAAKRQALFDCTQHLREGIKNSILGKSSSLSTRQMLRLARRMDLFPKENLGDAVRQTMLARFLPPLARESLEKLLSMVRLSPIFIA
jgi:hypothetical protein